jgi:putative ABC transport system permease protein
VPGVSVEGKVAESLKLKLGDHMVFSVGGVNREAKVTSLRKSTGTTSSRTSS